MAAGFAGDGRGVEALQSALEAESARAIELAARPGVLSRALDAVAGAFSPGWLSSRITARTELAAVAYQAAELNRLTADWLPGTLSGNQEIQPGLMDMNARARQGHRDSWAIRGVCDSYRRDVGCLMPRACARDPRAERGKQKLVAFNSELDWWWREWFLDPKLVDKCRRQSGPDMIGLGVEEWVQVGGVFFVDSFEARADAPMYVLQMIEIEQLAHDLYETAPNGNTIIGGVEVDRYGASVAYHVYLAEHPLEDPRAEATRVDAARVHHFVRPSRVRQVLGPSRLSPVLLDDRELQQYLQSEARAKRLEACIAWQQTRDATAKPGGLTNSRIGLGQGPENVGATDAKGRSVKAIEPGVILNNPVGQKLELMNPSRPGGTFDMYVKRRESHIAAGADRSRSSVTREFTASYTAERRGLIEDRKVNRSVQFDLLAPQILRPIRRQFVRTLLLQPGLLSPEAMAEVRPLLRDRRLRRFLFETEWMPPREDPIDEAKTAAARKINTEHFFDNRGDMLGQGGRDWRDNFEDIAEQRDVAEDLKIPLPEFAGGTGVDPAEPRPRGASNAPDGTADDDGEDDKKNNGSDTEDGDAESRAMGSRAARRRESTDALVDVVLREAVASDA